MGWGNCEDHYNRVSKELEKIKPMDTRTKLIILGWLIFLIGVIWVFWE